MEHALQARLLRTCLFMLLGQICLSCFVSVPFLALSGNSISQAQAGHPGLITYCSDVLFQRFSHPQVLPRTQICYSAQISGRSVGLQLFHKVRSGTRLGPLVVSAGFCNAIQSGRVLSAAGLAYHSRASSTLPRWSLPGF
jgi:hypothetical protein